MVGLTELLTLVVDRILSRRFVFIFFYGLLEFVDLPGEIDSVVGDVPFDLRAVCSDLFARRLGDRFFWIFYS